MSKIKEEIQNLVNYLLNDTTFEQKKIIFSFYPFVYIKGKLFYIVKKNLEVEYFYDIQTDTLYTVTFKEVFNPQIKEKVLNYIYNEILTITNQIENYVNYSSSN